MNLPSKAIPSVHLDRPFFFLSLWLIFINLPAVYPAFVMNHDTLYLFIHFYTIYSQFLFHGEIAQWLPYSVYGISSYMYFITMWSPFSFLMLFVGALFRITDVWTVFIVSILLEQFVFLTGMYLLSGILFSNRWTKILITLAAISSTVWLDQLELNFRIFYLFPLILFFIFKFFEQADMKFLLGVIVTSFFWFMGGAGYFIILQGWLLIAVFITLFFTHPRHKKFQVRPMVSIFFICFFLGLLTACYGLSAYREIALLAPSRLQNGSVDLISFLTYGGNPTLPNLLTHLFFGAPVFLSVGAGRGGVCDNTAYIGILPLFFFIWSLLFVRQVYFYLFVCLCLVLFLLSKGGVLATFIFIFFPGMNYYRHVGLVFGLIKILMLVLAGFGIDHFFKMPRDKKIFNTTIVLAVILILFDMILAGFWDLAFIGNFFDSEFVRFAKDYDLASLWFRSALHWTTFVVLYIFVRIFLPRCSSAKILPESLQSLCAMVMIFLVATDLFSYQSAVYQTGPKLKDLSYVSSTQAYPFKYIAQRSDVLDENNTRLMHALGLLNSQKGTIYDVSYNFLQADTCSSVFRVDHVMKDILLVKPYLSNNVNTIIGCQNDKMRYASNIVWVKDNDQALEYLSQPQKPVDLITIQTGAHDPIPTGNIQPFNKDLGDLNVIDFHANDLKVKTDVRAQNGLWLYYADSFHSGWKAYLDQTPVDLHRANIAFKAVFVPQGKHILELRFVDPVANVCTWIWIYLGILGALLGGVLYVYTLLGWPAALGRPYY